MLTRFLVNSIFLSFKFGCSAKGRPPMTSLTPFAVSIFNSP